MNIYDEYINYHNQYSKKYGKNTLVLFQCGSFYEVYSTVKNDISETFEPGMGPNVHEISQLLNIICTRKDKSINTIDRKNPYMMGFPTISVTKFINILVDNGYTLVIVDQVTPPPHPRREVTGIYSPGTYINGPQKPDHNFITYLFIEENIQKNGKYLLCAGMSAIDVTTGKCYIYESYSAESDDRYALDECIRFLNGINPTETIIHFKEQEGGIKKDDLFQYLELQNKKNVNFKKEINKKYTTLNYQTEFLKKVYPDCGQINPIEYLNLEKFLYCTVSLVLLLDFLYDHNNKIIDNLDKPHYYFDIRTVVLGNNAANQLNVIENNSISGATKYNSLFNVVNHTSTNMGRRFLKDRLTCPLISHNELNKNYECIEELLNKNKYLEIENILKDIADVERLEHKIPLGYLHPYEFYILYQSYESILVLLKEIKQMKKCNYYHPGINIEKSIEEFIYEINKTFNLEETKKHNLTEITTNIFQRNIYSDIDKIEQDIEDNNNFINEVRDSLLEFTDKDKNKKKISDGDNYISIKKNERDGHYLNMTKIRANVLKKNISKVKIINIKDYKLDPQDLIFKDNNNNTKIILPDIERKSDIINDLIDKIRSLNMQYYLERLNSIYVKYNDLFKTCSKLVAIIDFLKCGAKTSKLYGYNKPTIEYNNNYSYIQCKKLRHPIIERLIDYEYVPHDIEIGNKLKGILLYGLNSAGKCFDPNTLIKMFDGSNKKAKDIIKNDKLMGDDSTARTVLSTTFGKNIMYKIIPIKGEPIIVNGPHILVLKCSGYKSLIWQSKENRYRVVWFENEKLNCKSFTVANIHKRKHMNNYENKKLAFQDAKIYLDNVTTDKGKIIEISVDDYLKKPKQWKINYYLYKVGVEYNQKEVEIDPYILGYWLGDGTSSKSEITTENLEVVNYFSNYFKDKSLLLKNFKKFTYTISTGTNFGGKNTNVFTNFLNKYNLFNNKHIPNNYKYNSRDFRLKLLAGIIDSDGSNCNDYGFDLCLKNEKLFDDIIELCRSLGYSCYKKKCKRTCTNAPGGPKIGDYYRTYITGNNLNDIPLLLKYKIPNRIKTIRDDVLITSFKIENIGTGDYCGFEVDGNKRFLLDDFTVTHNSSSMKALGLCTILAQAGMFVPAEKCVFSPFKSIFTRITGNDNLFKGLSSFTLEMLELKAILKRAGPFTLVIGDEVCRGTEHISGNAIVASTIINLAKQNASFIFATHLHEIAQMQRIKDINTIKAYHLSVSYDSKTDSLVYDRQLKEGSGEPIYGITVAKYIIQDREFIDLALDIKNELLKNHGSMISGKTSKYNSDVFIHECQLCLKKDSVGFISNLQTHHINFQKDCQDGFVKDKKFIRKNDRANLIVLCTECHEKIHHNGLDIKGTVQTSKGKKLIIKNNIHIKKTSKKI